MIKKSPEILSPAGDKESFFAAISAGADAIYVGLKEFSARTRATNFNIDELKSLIEFANSKGVRVYVALNVMITQNELTSVCKYLELLYNYIKPGGIIVQDLGLVSICRKNGFDFEIHLSTLANVSLAASFTQLKELNIKRIVLPRELTIDEIKYLSQHCGDIGLEVFVHGALCYGVSGRCYWSSMLGGRSGLRGMCVQPCRRTYTYQGKKGKFFSCRDLGLDVLIKVLLKVPKVISLKIEGRKKGPHYVYYTTKAYRILRDNPNDPDAKKTALELINMNLGRKTTHYFFLSHRRYLPIEPYEDSASGIRVGKISTNRGRYFFRPHIDLLPGDRIRLSYEDQRGHKIISVNRFVKKGKKYFIDSKCHKGSPVFLIDRKEMELVNQINRLKGKWVDLLKDTKIKRENISKKECVRYFIKKEINYPKTHLFLYRDTLNISKKRGGSKGIWLYDPNMDIGSFPKDIWIWLDPVIWPEDEKDWKSGIDRLISKGFKFFIVNSPYHLPLFDLNSLHVWLGPFANIANIEAIYLAKDLGVKGVIVSVELSREDYLDLVKFSPLPLGIFIKGVWPYTISRIKYGELSLKTPIYSPKRETLYLDKIGKNYYVFPDFQIDLKKYLGFFERAGYKLFVEFVSISKGKRVKSSSSSFNWNFSK